MSKDRRTVNDYILTEEVIKQSTIIHIQNKPFKLLKILQLPVGANDDYKVGELVYVAPRAGVELEIDCERRVAIHHKEIIMVD